MAEWTLIYTEETREDIVTQQTAMRCMLREARPGAQPLMIDAYLDPDPLVAATQWAEMSRTLWEAWKTAQALTASAGRA